MMTRMMGLDERVLDLFHAGGDSERGIKRDDVIEVRGKLCLSFSMMAFAPLAASTRWNPATGKEQ